ncbi:agmatine deiminase family protein [Agaribacter marinus]|uniref:Agmatine deiminase n=1 Tax=Agaribacter marinus TaxID=1431249 RepID=A0AA37SXV4_9ALTE|nr:agmatine deiminase family protein [Agaribacter marinus]GLR71862.1 agmatine deiminase [Agaribacter marinus]
MFEVSKNSLTLLPEWADIEAVVLAWPHANSDWAPWLDDARRTYLHLIDAILNTGSSIVLLCQEDEIGLIKAMVPMRSRVLLVVVPYNDTWTRDYVFLTCESEHGNVPVEFTFNGWGQKFDASLDNQVNQALSALCQRPMISCDAVLEGGAIEIDQNQMLLSTASCLYNPRRNGSLPDSAYQEMFQCLLGAKELCIFEHGHLEGDDTDGHIDTLVRFTPLRGLVMQSAYNRTDDSHFEALFKLKLEIQKKFTGYLLYELPLPRIHNANGERLPASYANFLICNRTILAPIYQQEEDKEALEVLSDAYPNYKIFAIDCSTLIQQFGSLHCITMQIPENTLRAEILELTKNGLTRYLEGNKG